MSGKPQKQNTDTAGKLLPGYYDANTLPPADGTVKAILEKVQRTARLAQQKGLRPTPFKIIDDGSIHEVIICTNPPR